MIEIGFSWPALILALPAAGLGWWCARVACRYAVLLLNDGPFFDGAQLLLRAARPSGAAEAVCRLSIACAALMAGLVFVLWMRYGGSLLFIASVAALAILLVLAIVDAKTSLLPDALTLPLLWLGLACAWHQGPLVLQASVAGAMAGYVFLYCLFWLFRLIRRREGMGYGDFKLLAALGAWVGLLNVPYVLLTACLAGLLFAARQGQNPDLATVYPFGPFLAASGAAVMVFAPEVHSYF